MNSDNPRKRQRLALDSPSQERTKFTARDHSRDDTPSDHDIAHPAPGAQAFEDFHIEGQNRVHVGNHNVTTINNNYAPAQTPSNLAGALDPQTSTRQAFMDLLSFEEMDSRYWSIEKNLDKTCSWLLQREEYTKWRDPSRLDEHHGFLWIKGKAGTGKSTLMRYALNHAKKDFRNDMVISYFFHARGAHLERSVQGMFQALLHQIFENLSESAPVFETLRRHGHKLRSLKLEVLKDIFRLVVENLGQQPLTCFIDALDECNEDDVREMVAFLEELGRSAVAAGVKFQVCFSSRHYPHITITKGTSFDLEALEEHDADIVHYVESKLKIGQSKLAKEIRAEIERRAAGIFLWVHLVVRILNRAYDHGNVRSLQESLNQIPDGLQPLFRTIVESGNQDSTHFTITLQWVLFAYRPLKCEELYFAINSSEEPNAQISWSQTECTSGDMQRFILNSSKGLTEVTRGSKKTVQFIHESVRSYLLSPEGLAYLQPQLATNPSGLSHDSLKQCCQRYTELYAAGRIPAQTSLRTRKHRSQVLVITLQRPDNAPRELPQHELKEHPFLEYAIFGVLYHAEAAESSGVLQDEFVAALNIQNWNFLHNLLPKPTYDCDLEHPSKAYVFAKNSMNGLLKIETRQSMDWKRPTCHPDCTPLIAAIGNGNEGGVNILLSLGADPKSKASADTHAIHLATSLGHTSIVKALLDSGAEPGKTPPTLHIASAKGFRDIAELLLCHGADVNREGGHYGTALIAASYKGHVDIVRMLLKRNARSKIKPERNGTPLHAACFAGHEDVAKVLIEDFADVHFDYDTLGTPLHVASARGHTAVVRLLLSNGSNVNAVAGVYRTALRAASFHGHHEVVEVLLTSGADIDFFQEVPKVFPWKRATTSFITRLEGILAGHLGPPHNVDIDSQGTALQAAAQAVEIRTVEVLLRAGANPNAGVHRHSAALDAALTGDSNIEDREQISELLLRSGATALPFMLPKAAASGFGKVVDGILSQKSEIGWWLNEPFYRKALETAKGSILKNLDVSETRRKYEEVDSVLRRYGLNMGLDPEGPFFITANKDRNA